MSDELTDRAVAARFPVEWAKANNPALGNRSKRRQQLRKRYRDTIAFEAFRAANPAAACANCDNRHPWNGELTCDLENDFHGYAIVDPASVCIRWKASAKAQPCA